VAWPTVRAAERAALRLPFIPSHAVQQATSHLKYHSDTLMHTSLKNSSAEIGTPSALHSFLFCWRLLGYKLFRFFVTYIHITLVTSLLNFDVPAVYLFLMYFFIYKTSAPFILRHRLGSVLTGQRCVQVFQIEDTRCATSSLVGKGLLVFCLSEPRVLRLMSTNVFLLVYLIFMNLCLFVFTVTKKCLLFYIQSCCIS
jgi:hypothetical protein